MLVHKDLENRVYNRKQSLLTFLFTSARRSALADIGDGRRARPETRRRAPADGPTKTRGVVSESRERLRRVVRDVEPSRGASALGTAAVWR